jgi:DNA-binding winged helix-turn-helix (wHTH) protein
MRSLLDAGLFQLDENTFEILCGNESLILPENEGRILRELLKKSPEIVSKESLLFNLWGTSEYVDENILQVNMTRLRKDLDRIGLAGCVETIRGKGYRIQPGKPYET